MTTCRDIQNLLPISPVDVPAEEYRRVSEHLAACPHCRKAQEELAAIERAAGDIEVPDPGVQYWDSFALRVRERSIEEPIHERAGWVQWFTHRPVVSWPATAAAAVIVFFLVRAMLPVREQLSPVPTATTASPAFTEAQQSDQAQQGGKPASQPDAQTEVTKPAPSEEPVTLAEELRRTPTGVVSAGKAPEFKPDAVPEEERLFVSTPREERATDTGPPGRTTVILRGDTAGAGTNEGLPKGRDLELAERPNAPFPTGDTAAIPGQRVLGAPAGEVYQGVTPPIPALNRGEFTAEDREFFTEKITTLSDRLAKEKGEARRATCRSLVDMYYQLAMNWRSPADLEQALEFMAKARKILPEEDRPDLDTKTAALKSLQ